MPFAPTFPQIVHDKLAALPDRPGVYLMRNRRGRIIYIGKAASLRSRVSSYFRASTFAKAQPRLRGLIRSIADFDTVPLRSEPEAALTESKLIKEYRPRYNVLLKDDKRFLLLRIHPADPYPRVEAVRLRKDDGARYWGPYASTAAARATVSFVQRRFGLRTCRPRTPGADDHRHCHDDLLRFCAAPCVAATPADRAAYAARVADACAFLDGDHREGLADLKKEMEAAAAALQFEKAAALRDTWMLLLKGIRDRARAQKGPQILHAEAAAGCAALAAALALPAPPHRIECYDISNTSGTNSVASGVVAIDGIPAPQHYHRYRIKTVQGANDPASMAEVITRRFSRALDEHTPLPDLVIVDGGITQLRAARAALDALGLQRQPLAGLAKQMEELYRDPDNVLPPIRFPAGSPALTVITRLRDESHRFAITYHRLLRARRIRESVLDDIPGVGPARKSALLRALGTIDAIRAASVDTLSAVPSIGPAFAATLHAALHPSPA